MLPSLKKDFIKNSNDVLFDVLNKNKNKIRQKKSKTCDSIEILFRTLIWLGIIKAGNSESLISIKNFLQFAYPFLTHLITLDIAFVCIIQIKNNDTKEQVIGSYVFLTILSLLVWYAMRKKSKTLKILFHTLRNMSEDHKVCNKPRASILIFLFLFNILLLFCYSSSFILLPSEIDYMCKFYFYGIEKMCLQTLPNQIYIFLKAFFVRMPVFFNNAIAFVYCCLCYRCTALLRTYRECIQKIDFSKEDTLFLRNLALKYRNLHNAVIVLQDAFSLPSLLALTVAFVEAFIVLARFLIYPGEEVELFYMIEHLCVNIPAASFAFVIPTYAAQVSREMFQNKATFHKMYEDIIFYSMDNINPQNLRVLSILKRIKPVQLSGWEMVEFTGSTIPAVLGTLITYGLLILNLDA